MHEPGDPCLGSFSKRKLRRLDGEHYLAFAGVADVARASPIACISGSLSASIWSKSRSQ
jgi:hypothetical protein